MLTLRRVRIASIRIHIGIVQVPGIGIVHLKVGRDDEISCRKLVVMARRVRIAALHDER